MYIAKTYQKFPGGIFLFFFSKLVVCERMSTDLGEPKWPKINPELFQTLRCENWTSGTIPGVKRVANDLPRGIEPVIYQKPWFLCIFDEITKPSLKLIKNRDFRAQNPPKLCQTLGSHNWVPGTSLGVGGAANSIPYGTQPVIHPQIYDFYFLSKKNLATAAWKWWNWLKIVVFQAKPNENCARR